MTTTNPEQPEDENENDLIVFPQFFDNESKSRLLGMYGEVNEERSRTAVASLYYFRETGLIEEEVDSEEDEETIVKTSYLPIDFIVSTEGGSVTDMFALYDCLREIRKDCDIISFGVGKVMSAGVLLLAGGTKGKRKIGRNCRLMLHAISGGHFGSLKELETDIKEVKWYQARYAKALAEETNLTEKKIRAIFRKKTDTYFDAEQAVEWGIADEVV